MNLHHVTMCNMIKGELSWSHCSRITIIFENLSGFRYVTDATTAMFLAISLLMMPRYPPLIFKMKTSRPYEALMSFKSVSEKLNWGVVFLIAGGFALADCVHVS